MTQTIEAIRDQFRQVAKDVGGASWSDDAVEGWIYEAIHDFAVQVPPVFVTAATPTATFTYHEMDVRCRGIISVEWPANQDPPAYLIQRPYTSPGFWDSDLFYDFVNFGQEDSETTMTPRIFFGRVADGADGIRIYWRGDYTVADPRDPTEICPVPEQYHHILIAYVQWKSMQAELSRETADPDSTTLLLSQMATNADRAERAYRRALLTAQSGVSKGGAAGSWVMDKYDGRY